MESYHGGCNANVIPSSHLEHPQSDKRSQSHHNYSTRHTYAAYNQDYRALVHIWRLVHSCKYIRAPGFLLYK